MKNFKYLFSLTLASLLLTGCIVVGEEGGLELSESIDCDPSSRPFGGGSGTASEPYALCSPDHFYNMEYHSEYFVMAKDIDFSGETLSNGIDFYGTLDGNYKKLSNITMNNSNAFSYVGVFGYLGNANISLLTIENINLTVSDTVAYSIGGLAGAAYSSVISRVSVSGSIYYGGGMTGTRLGGIVGTLETSSSINQSTSTSTISGYEYVGGIAGYANSSYLYDSISTSPINGQTYVGGEVGFANNSHTYRANFYGSITSSGFQIGGIVGTLQNGSTISEAKSASGWIGGYQYVGGIAGNSTTGSIISSSKNESYINTTGQFTGGIVGEIDGGSLNYNLNTGTIVSTNSYIGGIAGRVGQTSSTVFYRNRNYGGGINQANSLVSQDYVGGLVGYLSSGTNIIENMSAARVRGINYVGGLFGYIEGSNTIVESYLPGVLGSPSAIDGSSEVGGFAGFVAVGTTIQNSYVATNVSGTNRGGFVGTSSSGTYVNCYWNDDFVFDGAPPSGISGLNSTEMQVESNFAGFDFTNTWIVWNQGGAAIRPMFRWEM
ncbi:MAG: hypothetical protein CL678_15015 [Bdellovibrionaceae bacterium]|nr:hypothetical protein [Pseudobdellovibrionaceae bacterium]